MANAEKRTRPPLTRATPKREARPSSAVFVCHDCGKRVVAGFNADRKPTFLHPVPQCKAFRAVVDLETGVAYLQASREKMQRAGN